MSSSVVWSYSTLATAAIS